MKSFERAYVKVYLDRIKGNMEAMQKRLPSDMKMIGVVKADAYGHGAVAVAKAVDAYVCGYAVAEAGEALELRKNGITKPILILGPSPESRYEEIIENEISEVVFDLKRAKLLSDYALKMGKKARIHIAVDTGMSRIGYIPSREAAEEIKTVSELPGIELRGMFTHFARADEADKASAFRQLKRFRDFTAEVKGLGVDIPVCHCANSASIMELEDAYMDAVRAGITMYGLYPSDEVDRSLVPIRPAMELKSSITYIKNIGPGTEVGYGGTFRAEKEMRIATVGIGYADGYPRSLSGHGSVLVDGKRAPILGRICMDQLMIDVSNIPEAKEGDEITLLGRDGAEEITMEELAAQSGVFHYEIPCLINKRVPRIYVDNGQITGVMTCGGSYKDI